MLNFEKCFRLRGIINQVSSNRLFQKLEQKQVIYAGFDPSASSLHVGNLLALITLMRFKSYGHDVIALVGGATAQIGDPSFRSTERNLLSDLENVKNTSSIISQINQVFKTSESYIKKYSLLEQGTLTIKNNLDWYSSMNILDFLKTIGNHHRISIMLSKDAVKSRLDSQTGMSYTEFTYPILQAYDFYYLYTKYNCTVQIGGSDQWVYLYNKGKYNIRHRFYSQKY